MGCGHSTLQHQQSLTKRYEAGTIKITAMASGLAPSTPYFSPYTRNRVKQASAYAQRLQELFCIYTPIALNLASMQQLAQQTEAAASGLQKRHTKIFCALGPASATETSIAELVNAGMDVAVLDLATGSHKEHQIVLDRIRRLEADRGCIVAVCVNTKRPNLYTGLLPDHQPLQLTAGQTLSLRGGSIDGQVVGGLDPKSGRITIHVTTDALCQIVNVGSTVVLGDDSVHLKVTSLSSDKQCEATVVKAYKPVTEHCNVTFPGCTIPSPSLAQPTFNDIKHFASAHRVDFVSAAYIQTAEDAQYLRRFMVECDHGESIRLIARIENEAGLRNVDDILGEADGIMLCRGSLSCELGPEKLALMQKLLAAKAQAAGKFLIVEGQVMESMRWQQQPLPCEVCDVSTAVFDGADGLVLTSATSIGSNPVQLFSCCENGQEPHCWLQAVQHTAAAMAAADFSLDGGQAYRHIHKTGMGDSESGLVEPIEAVISGAARAALDMRAGLVVILTTTGQSAYLLARYRLGLPILVMSQSEDVLRRCSAVRALFPYAISQGPGDLLEEPLQAGLKHARDEGMCPPGCRVVVLAENLADGPDTLPVLFTRVAPGDAVQAYSDTLFSPEAPTHRTLCPQTASLSIADTISPVSGPRLTKIMCILDPSAFSMGSGTSLGARQKAKRPEGLLARLSMGAVTAAVGSPVKAGGSASSSPSKAAGSKATSLKAGMSSSPVSGAIGALQAGQGQTRELMQELNALAQAGMNLACFDLAAGSLEQHLDLAEHVAEVQQQDKHSGHQLACVLNLAGPRAHITAFSTSPHTLHLTEGQHIQLQLSTHADTANTSSQHSNNPAAAINHPADVVHCSNLAALLDGAQVLHIAGSDISLEVVSKDAAKQHMLVKVMASGLLESGQSISCTPSDGIPAGMQISASDAKALQEFVSRQLVEYVAAPMASAADAVTLRQTLDKAEGRAVQILARVESVASVPELDQLLQNVAGVLIDKRHVGSREMQAYSPQMQKLLISRAKLAGRLCICTTDVLASAQAQTKPAAAEVADITNAVLDGCDCIAVLIQQTRIPDASNRYLHSSDSNSSWRVSSGDEDAAASTDVAGRKSGTYVKGRSFAGAVSAMRPVLQGAEGALDAMAMLAYLKDQAAKPLPAVYTAAISVVTTALDCHACLIVTLSKGARLPLAIAVGRPPVPQVFVTDSKAAARLCCPAYGVHDLVADSLHDTNALIAQAKAVAHETGLWNGTDAVVVVREDSDGTPVIAIHG